MRVGVALGFGFGFGLGIVVDITLPRFCLSIPTDGCPMNISHPIRALDFSVIYLDDHPIRALYELEIKKKRILFFPFVFLGTFCFLFFFGSIL